MSKKTLVVADTQTKLFVAGVALACVDLARTHGIAVQQAFLHHLDQVLDAANPDDRRALRSLYSMLRDQIRVIPSLEH